MAEEKGGRTTQVLQKIVGVDPDEDGYLLGACIQLIDDLHDLKIDLHDNIHTIASQLLIKEGKLDRLVYYTIHRISQLPNKYNLFRIGLLGMLVHTVTKNRPVTSVNLNNINPYSEECQSIISPYSVLGKTTGWKAKIYQKMVTSFKNNIT